VTPDGGRLLQLLPSLARALRPSRRQVIAGAGPLAGASLLLAGCRRDPASIAHTTAADVPAPASPPPGRVLAPHAWAIIEAAAARILPSDEGPGAREADVVAFIDAQLATPVLQPISAAVALIADVLDRAAHAKTGLGFVGLSSTSQDELLTALARGQLPVARFPQKQAFRALHSLTLEGFLSDSIYGGNRALVGWKTVGFGEPGLRPVVPTLAVSSRPRPAAPATAPAPDEVYDACIVGSGAGGGATAWALCRAGWKVLLLEKGPHIAAKDFVHDELGVCRRPYFMPNPMEDPNMVAAGGAAAERSAEGWISSCVGGGTVHMAGYFFRMRPEDFRVRSLYGAVAGASVADWPFRYEELLPHYLEVERTIGVSGDAGAEPHHRPAYPLAPLLSHPAGALVDRACSKAGMRSFRIARAIVSADYADARPVIIAASAPATAARSTRNPRRCRPSWRWRPHRAT
jgi:hypothetical protein